VIREQYGLEGEAEEERPEALGEWVRQFPVREGVSRQNSGMSGDRNPRESSRTAEPPPSGDAAGLDRTARDP